MLSYTIVHVILTFTFLPGQVIEGLIGIILDVRTDSSKKFTQVLCC